LIISVIAIAAMQVNAYPGGAPESTCNSRNPGHRNSRLIQNARNTFGIRASRVGSNSAEGKIDISNDFPMKI